MTEEEKKKTVEEMFQKEVLEIKVTLHPEEIEAYLDSFCYCPRFSELRMRHYVYKKFHEAMCSSMREFWERLALITSPPVTVEDPRTGETEILAEICEYEGNTCIAMSDYVKDMETEFNDEKEGQI